MSRLHDFYQKIEDDSHLAKMFNMVFKETRTFRSFSCPWMQMSFSPKEHIAETYYQTAMLETYLHAVISSLREWKEKLSGYNENASWKWFALQWRRELIEKWGGEEEDYDEEGKIRSDFTDEELRYDSLVEFMASKDHRSIFHDVRAKDLEKIYYFLSTKNEVSVFKVFDKMGIPIQQYQKTEDGEMVEVDWASQKLNEAKEQHVCDTLAEMLHAVVSEINKMVLQVRKKPYDRNHKAFFKTLEQRVQNLLDLKIEMPKKEGGDDER